MGAQSGGLTDAESGAVDDTHPERVSVAVKMCSRVLLGQYGPWVRSDDARKALWAPPGCQTLALE